ncbi:phage protein, HK97 gp10 family [Mesobacillus persicus]|uniref:Phage protein, HK97 gp10 family n=1 Tax=Mesobacillus persicus TaxID=930146 RepID=A0A1H7XM67_9BACI|nr:HK97-gp10 family putative phage morphogenesis protein [Mesobacillus persicus]SEM34841.1 phage protein, HK97 gp10 family [Mesobacillus persicus]
MAKSSIDVNGMNDIFKKIEKMGREAISLKQEATKKAAEHTEKELKQEAKKLDDHYFTKENLYYGTLEENIRFEPSDNEEGQIVHTHQAYWSQFLEFGTVKMSAQPFMEKTFHNEKKKMQDIIEEELKKGLGL